MPSAAYSYTFQGQAQTLDHLFVNPALYGDLVQMRAAHINAGFPADFAGDGPRGVPATTTRRWPGSAPARRWRVGGRVRWPRATRATTAADFTVKLSRPLSQPALICADHLGITAPTRRTTTP